MDYDFAISPDPVPSRGRSVSHVPVLSRPVLQKDSSRSLVPPTTEVGSSMILKHSQINPSSPKHRRTKSVPTAAVARKHLSPESDPSENPPWTPPRPKIASSRGTSSGLGNEQQAQTPLTPLSFPLHSRSREAEVQILRNVLRTEPGLRNLTAYLTINMPAECQIPKFWYACEGHKKLLLKEALTLSAMEICVQYIAPSAPQKIPLTAALTKQLLDHAHEASASFFNRAQQELFSRFLWLFSGQNNGASMQILANLGDALGMLGANTDSSWDVAPAPTFDSTKYRARFKALRRALDLSIDRSKRAMAKHRKDSFRNAGSSTRVANSDIPATQIDEDPMANTSPFQVPFGNSLGVLLRCHYWGYSGNSSFDPTVLGKNYFHRKQKLSGPSFKLRSKSGHEEDPLLMERRLWAEEQNMLWQPSDSKHHGLKSSLIAANEQLEDAPVSLFWCSDPRIIRVVCVDGAILTYTVATSGFPYRVVGDFTLQNKIREVGEIRSATQLIDGSVALSFAESADMGRIRIGPDGSASLSMNSNNTKEVGSNRYFSNTNLSEVGKQAASGRTGGRLSINSDSSLAVTWWPRQSPDAFHGNNVVLSSIRLVAGWDPELVTSMPTQAEVIGVFWGALINQQDSSEFLHILTVEQSTNQDSITTLKSYEVSSATRLHESQIMRTGRGGQSDIEKSYFFHRQHKLAPVEEILVQKSLITTVVPGTISTQAFTPLGSLVIVVSQSGHLVVLDPSSRELVEGRASISNCTAATWHPEGAIVLVANDRTIQLFDVALSPIIIAFSEEVPQFAPWLDLSFTGYPGVLSNITWLPRDKPVFGRPVTECRKSDVLAVSITGGPVIYIKIFTSSLKPASMGLPWLIRGRLASNDGIGAAKLLSRLRWQDISGSFRLLSDVINFFLRQPFSQANNETIRKAFPKWTWHIAEVQNNLFTLWDARVQALQRRYFIYLLENRKLLLALHLATELKSRELCQALVVAASAVGGTRGNYVAIIAKQAYEMTSKSTVSFV